jgi:hypothetical protein
MNTSSGDRGAGDRPPLLPLLGLVGALITLSLAQPLLDLLARNPEFFVARSAPPSDVVGVAIVVAVVLPCVLAVVAWGAGRIHPVAGRAVAGGFIAIAAAPLFLRLIRGFAAVPGWGLVAVALGAGAGAAFLLERSRGVRAALPYGILLPVLLVAWFTFMSPVAALVAPPDVELLPRGTVGAPKDIVFLVFDEFPLATLLDADGGIDDDAFPNFARLAATSTWFRRATTVHRATTQAVPAILDGRYPRDDVLPTAADRPQNLFTLVGSDLDVVAEEAVSQMCPASICEKRVAPAAGRIETLASDVGILTGHMILPPDLAASLPPVDEGWGFFGGVDAADPATTRPPPDERGEAWVDPGPGTESFISRIRASERPTLYFKHALLPHTPWRYLPSGQEYPQSLPVPGSRPIPGRNGSRWIDDRWLVAQGYQRHLLQAMNTDRLVGAALDRLTASGLLDDALIVVVSDHGAAFTPGRPRRGGGAGTAGEVGPVPLFVKLPGRAEARVVDRPVQTVDVLPTIADVLEADPGWDFGGTSLLDTNSYIAPRERPGLTRLARRFVFGPRHLPEIVLRKLALFGSPDGGIDPYLLAPEGTRPLLGKPIPNEANDDAGTATVENEDLLQNVDLQGPSLPVLIEGEIALDSAPDGRPTLALSVNGSVAAVTLGYGRDDSTWRFQALVPPFALREGQNQIEVFLRDESAGRPSFYRLYPD